MGVPLLLLPVVDAVLPVVVVVVPPVPELCAVLAPAPLLVPLAPTPLFDAVVPVAPVPLPLPVALLFDPHAPSALTPSNPRVPAASQPIVRVRMILPPSSSMRAA
jgi:hypothetical protein